MYLPSSTDVPDHAFRVILCTVGPYLHDIGVAEARQDLDLLVHAPDTLIAFCRRCTKNADVCQRQLFQRHERVAISPVTLSYKS